MRPIVVTLLLAAVVGMAVGGLIVIQPDAVKFPTSVEWTDVSVEPVVPLLDPFEQALKEGSTGILREVNNDWDITRPLVMIPCGKYLRFGGAPIGSGMLDLYAFFSEFTNETGEKITWTPLLNSDKFRVRIIEKAVPTVTIVRPDPYLFVEVGMSSREYIRSLSCLEGIPIAT